MSRTVRVPAARVVRWFDNFATRHGEASISVEGGRLVAVAADGAVARASLPFGREYGGPPTPASFADAAAAPVPWGLLLVRKGGFAVAVVRGTEVVSSKVGRRHVQGRTKAGGQSQQRFARRRDNQARQAYEAAAEHAARILVGDAPRPAALVCGGDRAAVDAVLSDSRLARLRDLRVEPWLPVPDPRASEVARAVQDGSSASVEVDEPGSEP
ncbi:MAG TPA: acVLRF1 family peptidyl-tRNA hydrolase [Nocardioides sp.]|nr:acVLRF1 family peptidyl-tRNA hydrolase [Nocardioides sp.]